ncbi:hypothetical protein CEXT_76121 [Caerostris extrusa]|uniref:Uncharacterized protein n=1 Tax=Caerostris extrusa TaxID=172846 RepID=A0AAV4Y9Z2_CAEEX|nr:hypothetical protein CEXT_76121 [Caerostris extrusa]
MGMILANCTVVLFESQFTTSGVISNYDISRLQNIKVTEFIYILLPTPKGISRKLIFNRASHASLLHPRYKYSERHKTKGVHKFPEVACNRTTPIRQGGEGGQTAAVAPAEKRNAKRKEKQKVSEMKVSMEAADTPLTRNEPGITTEADVTATDHSLFALQQLRRASPKFSLQARQPHSAKHSAVQNVKHLEVGHNAPTLKRGVGRK